MIQALLPGPVEAALAAAAAWLLTYLVHSTLLLGLAWAVDGRTPVTRDPSVRSALWKAAVAGGLITASLQLGTGAGTQLELDVAEAEKLVAEVSAPPASDRPGAARPATEPPAARRTPRGEPSGMWRRPGEAGPLAWIHGLEHGWPFLVVVAALLAGAVGLARRATWWRRLRRQLGDRRRVRSASLRAALEAVKRAAGTDRAVRFSRSGRLPAPVALPGGEICVPDDLARRLDPEARKAVLAHELAHLERGDPGLLAALAALEGLFPFQPLNRLARRRLRAISETLADDRVRGLGLGPALADGLVRVARRSRETAGRAPAAELASPPTLEGRVGRLLGGRPGPLPPAGGAATLAVGALLAAVLWAAPSVDLDLTGHRAHLDAPPGSGAPGRVEATVLPAAELPGADAGRLPRIAPSLEGEGSAAYLRLVDVRRPLRLTLRPGRGPLRLTLPDGREVEAAAPDGREVLHLLRVTGAPAGDYVLHVPASVRRLAVEVDGRLLTAARPPGGELPEVVPLGSDDRRP